MRLTYCKYCNKEFNLDDIESYTSVAGHVRWCERNPSNKDRKLNEVKICGKCKHEFVGRRKYCSDKCSFSKTQETKDKISKQRKKYLKENPSKHVWKKKDKFKSVPCEIVKEYLLSKDIKFVDEWQPLENRFFSIDIAFPDIKLGLEINGNQHYNGDGTLKEYYQKRHDIIEEEGWKLIELHYSIAWNLDQINDIIQFEKQPDYTSYFEEKERRKNKNKRVANWVDGRTTKLIKIDEKWEPYKEIILNSDINFSKYGWVGEVAKILNIHHQKVNKWMKRYLNDFYNTECYKRNNNMPLLED